MGGRGAQLLANVNSMNGGSGGSDMPQRRERGPQAKVFGIPEGTSQVTLPTFRLSYLVKFFDQDEFSIPLFS